MKLLHIADLHAGKRLYEHISRQEDLLYALEQVKDICKKEGVEVLLIAGDIFDRKAPDFESQNIVMDFFVELSLSGVHVVAIAGNHDSYDFMKVHKNLKKLSKIHIFDRPARNLSDAVFELGELKIACLPYPSERVLTDLQEDRKRSYAEKVAQYMRALSKETGGARYRLLLAHIMLDRAQTAGSELYSEVSPYYAVRADTIPEDFHYVALGHVHRYQKIEDVATKVYYTGSLYQIDFSEGSLYQIGVSEKGTNKFVNLPVSRNGLVRAEPIEIDLKRQPVEVKIGTNKFVNLLILEDGLVRVEPIRIGLKRQLVEVRIGEKENLQSILEPLSRERVLVKVLMEVNMRDPFYNMKKEMVHRILGEKLARLEVEPVGNSESLRLNGGSLSIMELYEEYCKEEYRTKPSEELKELLKELIERVSHETNQA